MHQAYKFQLYPTKTQEQLLLQIAGNCRWVWNHMLAQQIVKYQQEKKVHICCRNGKSITTI
jgi:transposase